ncbi:MAG: HAMP domain-containing histidine kinase [Chloroflexota bacterium]|nr:HAMP domain-containing histidine kinase [Chloroflexota bacterium]MDE3193017.1 HAMP domain-containing histidine kinase [Chloroflexota bacterium]
MLEEQFRAAEVKLARTRGLLVALALLLTLVVLSLPGQPLSAEIRGAVQVLFVVQVLLALAVVGRELVRITNAAAERRALRRHAVALLTAHDERRKALEERDELSRTVAGLRALNDHLRDELHQRDEAVASAVHELRNPLTSVQAYGQLMSRNLQSVQRQVEQLERLISDLLSLPGARPIVESEVDLVREAREAASRLRLLTDTEVAVDVDGPGPFLVRGDPGRLGQVLDNLLRNAAKFSPHDRPIEIEVRREGEELQLGVTDHGSGIPSEELTLIFERYYRGTGQRRDVVGEGIGLAVSREIVLQHGGRIWATSPGAGQGSTFYIAFPAARPLEVPDHIPTAVQ